MIVRWEGVGVAVVKEHEGSPWRRPCCSLSVSLSNPDGDSFAGGEY